jgi:hypothetical protein
MPKRNLAAWSTCFMSWQCAIPRRRSQQRRRIVAVIDIVKSSILIFPQALAAAKRLHQLPKKPLRLLLLLLWTLLIALQGTRGWTRSLACEVRIAVLELCLRTSGRRLHLPGQSTTSFRYVVVSGACAVSRVPPYCCDSWLCWRPRSGRLCRV